MSYKKMVHLWFLIVLPVTAAIFLFNFFIDPLWCYDHSNRWNNHQPGFNERQQKTNRIHFIGLEKYDTLLLGSSRTAYIDQHSFTGMKVFNYAADNMLPTEYEAWIDIATRFRGAPFHTVIIGIDFFGTAKNYDTVINRFYHGKKPHDYVEKSSEPLYRYKTLLSLDALNHSIESVQRTLHPTVSDYDRRNVRRCNVIVTPEERSEHIRRDIAEYLPHLRTGSYRYRTVWPEMIRRLKRRYSDTRFIFFTTPVSRPFFEKIVRQSGRLDDYKRWLRQTVEAAGSLFHFMDINSVTVNLDNFFDAHHMYSHATDWIARRISGEKSTDIPSDFGKVLTPANLEEYLRRQKGTNVFER